MKQKNQKHIQTFESYVNRIHYGYSLSEGKYDDTFDADPEEVPANLLKSAKPIPLTGIVKKDAPALIDFIVKTF